MRAARMIVTVLAASLLLGVPAASAAPRVSIHVKRVIAFGQSARLTGRLAGVKKHAGVRMALEIKLFPYRQVFRRVATRKTDSAGRVTFRAKRDRNARYRVRVP